MLPRLVLYHTYTASQTWCVHLLLFTPVRIHRIYRATQRSQRTDVEQEGWLLTKPKWSSWTGKHEKPPPDIAITQEHPHLRHVRMHRNRTISLMNTRFIPHPVPSSTHQGKQASLTLTPIFFSKNKALKFGLTRKQARSTFRTLCGIPFSSPNRAPPFTKQSSTVHQTAVKCPGCQWASKWIIPISLGPPFPAHR